MPAFCSSFERLRRVAFSPKRKAKTSQQSEIPTYILVYLFIIYSDLAYPTRTKSRAQPDATLIPTGRDLVNHLLLNRLALDARVCLDGKVGVPRDVDTVDGEESKGKRNEGHVDRLDGDEYHPVDAKGRKRVQFEGGRDVSGRRRRISGCEPVGFQSGDEILAKGGKEREVSFNEENEGRKREGRRLTAFNFS